MKWGFGITSSSGKWQWRPECRAVFILLPLLTVGEKLHVPVMVSNIITTVQTEIVSVSGSSQAGG